MASEAGNAMHQPSRAMRAALTSLKRALLGVLVGVSSLMGGCADDQPATRRTAAASPTPPPEVGNFPPESKGDAAEADQTTSQVAGPVGENPAVVFEAFQNDVAACVRLIDLMRSDAVFANAIDQAIDSGRGDGVGDVLRNARIGGTKELRHLAANLDSIRLGHSAHGEPFAAAVLPARGVYCSPSRERLSAIERLGPSAQAWRVREYFLTGTLRAVRMPWDAHNISALSFESLLSDVESAARLYRGMERTALEGWIAGAISHLLREQTRVQLTDSTEARQQEGVVSAWIAMLEGIRSIRTEQAMAP